MDPSSHPDRHGFLHTPECNEKWRTYLKCCEDNPFLRTFVDYCGTEFAAVDNCFKKERQSKAKINHKLASRQTAENVKKFALLDSATDTV